MILSTVNSPNQNQRTVGSMIRTPLMNDVLSVPCACVATCVDARRREPTSTARRGERAYSQINSERGCEGSRGEITQSVFPSTAGVLSFSHTFLFVWEVGGGYRVIPREADRNSYFHSLSFCLSLSFSPSLLSINRS